MKKTIFTIIIMLLVFVNFTVLKVVQINLNNTQIKTEAKYYNLVVDYEELEYKVLETFYGQLTAYGADCKGCSGITASGYNINNGNTTYVDKEFGNVRIIAADPRYRFGTIIKITEETFFKQPFFAIVLDRGGAVKGNVIDLAFETRKDNIVWKLGRRKNVKYEVLRYGY